MRLAGQSIRRPSLLMLLLPFLFLLVRLELGSATDLPIYGGLGGNTFRAECPKGSYLVGLAGRTGSWVDRIAPVCAPWLRGSQTLGSPSIGPSFGASGGGQEHEAICTGRGNNRVAIQSWWIHVLRSDNHYVQYVEVFCTPLIASVSTNTGWRLGFGARPNDVEEMVTGGPFGSEPPFQACPAGEIATGIRVRAGKYVDAIGLICGPLPVKLGASSPRLPGSAVQAPSPAVTMNPQAKNLKIGADMFVITKPVPGQLIPHGQLIIAATAPDAPPTVGPPRYAELELRCLEAPSNLQFSYPYLTVIAVEEAKLRQGFAVEKSVTSACSGAWQVRARFSLNAPTGPWSAAVPFGLCFDNCPAMPPSPVQQTAPLPSSAIQAPPPSSAPAQMRRSPSMIMPRGVDEKEASGEGAGPTEPEKKP